MQILTRGRNLSVGEFGVDMVFFYRSFNYFDFFSKGMRRLGLLSGDGQTIEAMAEMRMPRIERSREVVVSKR
jgi:hypothetical protein